MYLLWFLGALSVAHGCLGKGVPDRNLTDCSITGELPAPQIFLNVSAAHEGDSVSIQCTFSSDSPVTAFFLCKDGKSISSQRPQLHDAAYMWVFQISEQSAGQYSCGYKIKDKTNQEKMSALSPPGKLAVLPRNHDESSGNSKSNIFTVLEWILPVVCVVILILATLVYFLVKKDASQRSPREQGPVTNTFEENIQYASIVGLQHTGPAPLRSAETPYATINPLKQISPLHYEPVLEPSWNR